MYESQPIRTGPADRWAIASEARSAISGGSSASSARREIPRPSSGIDVFVDLARVRVGRGQRVLHAAVDLRPYVGDETLEGVAVDVGLEPGGQRLQRVVLAHPLALLLA